MSDLKLNLPGMPGNGFRFVDAAEYMRLSRKTAMQLEKRDKDKAKSRKRNKAAKQARKKNRH
jgi:hypothetical protein